MSGDADLLRRAAALVREHAAGTSLAPWGTPYEDEDVPGFPVWMLHNGGVGMKEHAVAHTFALSPNQEADARWLSFASPHIAEPLAAWLDDTATAVEQRWMVGALAPPNWVTSALITARALLGEAT